jgi:hypothetical protein
MIAGIGDRMLTAAVRHADIVTFPSRGARDHLVERVAFFKDKAGDRFADIELAFSFVHVGIDDPNDLSVLQAIAPGVPDDELRKEMTYLPGPVDEAAERIRSLHEELGINYFTFAFGLTPTVKWETLEKLLAAGPARGHRTGQVAISRSRDIFEITAGSPRRTRMPRGFWYQPWRLEQRRGWSLGGKRRTACERD